MVGRALVGYLILAAALVAALAAGYVNDRHICDSAKENRQILRQLIQSGDPLDEKGKFRLKPTDPGYDYYVARPAERAAAHRRNQRILRETVPPIDC